MLLLRFMLNKFLENLLNINLSEISASFIVYAIL